MKVVENYEIMKVVENYEISVTDNSNTEDFKKSNSLEVEVAIERKKNYNGKITSVFYCIKALLPQITDRIKKYIAKNPECHLRVVFTISNDVEEELRFPTEIYIFVRDIMPVLSANEFEEIEMEFEVNNCQYDEVKIIGVPNYVTYRFINSSIGNFNIDYSGPYVVLEDTKVDNIEISYSQVNLNYDSGSKVNSTFVMRSALDFVDQGSNYKNITAHWSTINFWPLRKIKVSNVTTKYSSIRAPKYPKDVTVIGDLDSEVEYL